MFFMSINQNNAQATDAEILMTLSNFEAEISDLPKQRLAEPKNGVAYKKQRVKLN
jgi:hypothetical protein